MIAQLAVPGKTNEHKTALELLKLIPLEGTLITGDAAFTQRDLCEAVIRGQGDYFLTVKDNQPTLEADIRAAFGPAFSPSGGEAAGRPRTTGPRPTVRATAGSRPGGSRTTTRLTGYLDWPGVKQVCRIERVRRIKGKATTETVCAVTSLGPEQASAAKLLEIARGHWEIENRLHWVRDMSLGEDACRVRTGDAPQMLSGLRNTVVYVLRATGLVRIAEAFRHLAAQPHEAVERVMQNLPTEL